MYTQEMLIGIAIGCVVGGIILGLVAGRFFLRSKHAATLERELSEAQEAMKDYKNDVFQQFGDTARKFEKLNESYADLHQQLATSAAVLCADMPNVPLIASSTVPALQANAETVDVTPEDNNTASDNQESTGANLSEDSAQDITKTIDSAEVVEPITPTDAEKPPAS